MNGPHPFAPDSITRHVHPQRRALARWLKRAAALMVLAALFGLLAGLYTGPV